ncbi:unnamed protein product [Gongylonema pulchrum]|uniref:SH2 domain-containing protein n=1 Tax=Gongylonema pulchrum TaxID=637853 RepID=A0A3P7N6G1_9BILA|nr:unnamed protein product [Gongylonema pulchrum]
MCKGDVVTVLEKSSDGWWKGKCREHTGWFPSNYIDESPPNTFGMPKSNIEIRNGFSKVVETNPDPAVNHFALSSMSERRLKNSASNTGISPRNGSSPPRLSGPYATQPWYYGRLSRDETDTLLNARGTDGDFLVRDSESNPGDYSISLKATGRNKHFWVQVDTVNNSFKIGTRTFATMDDLLKHYMASPIYTNDKTNERLFLIRPLPQ